MALAKRDATSEDALWDISVGKKSWADIVEEEEEKASLKALIKTNVNSTSLESSLVKVENLPTFGSCAPDTPEKKIKTEKPAFVEEDISLTGHLDKFNLKSPLKEQRLSVIPETERTPTKEAIKRKLGNDITDESLMPSPSKISKPSPRKAVRNILMSPRRVTRSSSSVQSPGISTRSRTPNKTPNGNENKSTPRSSQKTPGSYRRTPGSERRDLGRKRLREVSSTPNSDKTKRDRETDPETLARRQKQIDYGKNTLGYERYTQLVPRDARHKKHPKTPPLQIKFSRRAWDGLVKKWRKRLHFWDPPSEGGGNPDLLDVSDFSDFSDSSVTNTPVQVSKKQKNSVSVKSLLNELDDVDDDDEDEDDFESQGCRPLDD